MSKEEIDKLATKLVIEGENGYELFGEYFIASTGNMFTVTKDTSFLEHKFHNIRNAAVWATLDKINKVTEAKHVLELDKILEGCLASAELHKKLCKRTNSLENKSLYYAKLQEDNVKRKYVLSQLDSYANQVKIWQENRFKEAAK